MNWLRLARVVAEVVIDAVTGKLERREPPARVGLTHAESELQSKYAREAGRHGTVTGGRPPRGR